ncbi:MAG: class I SAM-dependent methyltransferase [Pseudomonadota bacterium]
MPTMHDVLTEEEMSEFRINPEISRYLELVREKSGLEKDQFRILDWGCGRGRAVGLLRNLGYDAYGVDISQEFLSKGKQYFINREENPDDFLFLISEECKTCFHNDFFHFIFSYQVLEHVQAVDLLSEEISRVLAPNGVCLHIYPAHKHIIEGHLFMPFVHWLPKSAIRKAAILMFVALGIEPRWQRLQGKGILEKARAYYEFSKNETFYRSYGVNKNIFEKNGFNVDFVTIDNPLLYKYGPLRKLMKLPFIKRLIGWGLLNFKSVELLLTKGNLPVVRR